MIMLINAEKTLNKLQHTFMKKISQETRNRWKFPEFDK
jgi:hypothetical protein